MKGELDGPVISYNMNDAAPQKRHELDLLIKRAGEKAALARARKKLYEPFKRPAEFAQSMFAAMWQDVDSIQLLPVVAYGYPIRRRRGVLIGIHKNKSHQYGKPSHPRCQLRQNGRKNFGRQRYGCFDPICREWVKNPQAKICKRIKLLP